MAGVDSPGNIPLGEAVARGIIPCSVCGASGAGVRKVGDKNHFLCPKCARRGGAWLWILTSLTVVIVGLVGYLLFRGKGSPTEAPTPPGPSPTSERSTSEIILLLEAKKYREARTRLQEILEPLPKRPDLNLLMGQCLMGLRAYEAAIPHFTVTYEAGPPLREQAALWLGLCQKSLGHSAEALKYLEQPSELNQRSRGDLAEVYLDLERYEEALKLLPDPSDAGSLWARHRALVYLGRGEEAKKLLEGRDPEESAALLAGQLREEGDFGGAAKALESITGLRAKKARLSLAIEAGDLTTLEKIAAELPPEDGAFARAIGHLMAGRREQAKTAAFEFLYKTDKDFSPLRLERLMMRHLAGELKDADLEAEVKVLSRFHANDLLWYLALATGDRAWAEKALASTPGRNYPYHAIQRLLKK